MWWYQRQKSSALSIHVNVLLVSREARACRAHNFDKRFGIIDLPLDEFDQFRTGRCHVRNGHGKIDALIVRKEFLAQRIRTAYDEAIAEIWINLFVAGSLRGISDNIVGRKAAEFEFNDDKRYFSIDFFDEDIRFEGELSALRIS
jgi:hypothetical protein